MAARVLEAVWAAEAGWALLRLREPLGQAKQQSTLHGRVHETVLAARRSGAETTPSDAEME